MKEYKTKKDEACDAREHPEIRNRQFRASLKRLRDDAQDWTGEPLADGRNYVIEFEPPRDGEFRFYVTQQNLPACKVVRQFYESIVQNTGKAWDFMDRRFQSIFKKGYDSFRDGYSLTRSITKIDVYKKVHQHPDTAEFYVSYTDESYNYKFPPLEDLSKLTLRDAATQLNGKLSQLISELEKLGADERLEQIPLKILFPDATETASTHLLWSVGLLKHERRKECDASDLKTYSRDEWVKLVRYGADWKINRIRRSMVERATETRKRRSGETIL
jgi:hypothetical protein